VARIIGAEILKGQLAGLSVAMGKERANACVAACHVFERRAKWYASGHGGGPHRRTGDLNNSIQTRQTASDEAQVAPATDYAAFVEYGTVNMPAFPYMRPAWESGKAEAEKVLQMRLGAVVSAKGVIGAQMGTTTEAFNAPLPEE
jgi:HK97 gp10 family phage protein